jgi:hypothetical protein
MPLCTVGGAPPLGFKDSFKDSLTQLWSQLRIVSQNHRKAFQLRAAVDKSNYDEVERLLSIGYNVNAFSTGSESTCAEQIEHLESCIRRVSLLMGGKYDGDVYDIVAVGDATLEGILMASRTTPGRTRLKAAGCTDEMALLEACINGVSHLLAGSSSHSSFVYGNMHGHGPVVAQHQRVGFGFVHSAVPYEEMTHLEVAAARLDCRMAALLFRHGAHPKHNVFDGVYVVNVVPAVDPLYDEVHHGPFGGRGLDEDPNDQYGFDVETVLEPGFDGVSPLPGFVGLHALLTRTPITIGCEKMHDARLLVKWLCQCGCARGSVLLDPSIAGLKACKGRSPAVRAILYISCRSGTCTPCLILQLYQM